uniref:Uncharacterized protein n=1 Tax=Nelumbo nucifera TaxID=4432 RepID=A0A822ZUA5_NELNU|nr:TPA_asm: hypothetical protein HUJ06_017038 [Nelumbo nucifera]
MGISIEFDVKILKRLIMLKPLGPRSVYGNLRLPNN